MATVEKDTIGVGGSVRSGSVVSGREPRPCLHGGRHRHGTRACHQADGCHCRPCEEANSDYYERRNRLIAAGQWAPMVDAGPVAQHVRDLIQAGMLRKQVVELAGVPCSVVSKVLAHGGGGKGVRRVRAETAQRLLAVSRPGRDATGTRRRLQALVAIGWSSPLLNLQLGAEPGWVEGLLQVDLVSDATAGQVARLFERLWDSPPPQRTEEERRAADQARAWAKRNGWGPPMAWDEDLNPIDDPDAEPDLGQKVRTRKVPPADELLFLMQEGGETIISLARRFDVREDTIRQALRRGRRAALDAHAEASAQPPPVDTPGDTQEAAA